MVAMTPIASIGREGIGGKYDMAKGSHSGGLDGSFLIGLMGWNNKTCLECGQPILSRWAKMWPRAHGLGYGALGTAWARHGPVWAHQWARRTVGFLRESGPLCTAEAQKGTRLARWPSSCPRNKSPKRLPNRCADLGEPDSSGFVQDFFDCLRSNRCGSAP